MTAGKFITTLVNGTKDTPGLSKYGFTVDTRVEHGVTIPIARSEPGYFVLIVKAIDYAHLDLKDEHIAPVAVNESLNQNYMYLVFPLAIDFPDEVNVTIKHEDGSEETMYLNPDETYVGQGFSGYYSQDTYDSSIGEMSENYLVDNNYPTDAETIYDYCNDTYVSTVTVTITHEAGSSEDVQLDSTLTYAEQGFRGYYSTDSYDSSMGETEAQYYVDINYPDDGDIIYDYCNDIYEPEPTMVNVTIGRESGETESVMLDSEITYADQGHAGYYSQNTYNSSEGESADNFLVDSNCPGEGEIIYDYCNDTYNEEPEH